jgi:hypothetical protein
MDQIAPARQVAGLPADGLFQKRDRPLHVALAPGPQSLEIGGLLGFGGKNSEGHASRVARNH